MLRRKALRLFELIKQYIHQKVQHGGQAVTTDNIVDQKEATSLWTVLKGLDPIMNAYQIDLKQLRVALNTPFFHPAYDTFDPYNSSEVISSTEKLNRAASFAYRPLETSTWIRLVEILPAIDPDTMIQCRVFEVNLDDTPAYAALSYNWRSSGATNEITIHGHVFRVLDSQLELLRSMRSRVEDDNPAIWLDALCIDMTNLVERSRQISLMARIYGQAREVVVALSGGDEAGDESVVRLAELASSVLPMSRPDPLGDAVSKAKQAILDMEVSDCWRRILQMFDSPWWTRRWVIQEIVLGLKAVILWGSLSFNFDIVEQIMLADGWIKSVLHESRSTALQAVVESNGWQTAREIVHTRLEYRQGKPFELPMLFWRFRGSISADRRDVLYSLLHLCAPETIDSFEIDYSISVAQLALETSRWFLRTYKNLDFLAIRAAYLPTWDTGESSWALPIAASVTRTQPLELGIFTGSGASYIYSAAGPTQLHLLIPTDDPTVLGCCGMTFDTVQELAGSSLFQPTDVVVVASLCRDIEHAQSSLSVIDALQHTVEARWRTILANQWPMGTKLTSSSCCGITVPPQTEAEEDALLNVIDPRYDLALLDGRRVIITAEGRLGLAPQWTLEGDSIVILSGGSTPYILRPHINGRYQFIGACYIHDCMDGQVLESASMLDKDWCSESFYIV